MGIYERWLLLRLLDLAMRNKEATRYRRETIPAATGRVLERSAEEIPLESRSIDTVVTTFTRCTVPDAAKALREARRVLKPGGTLLFAEHGHAPDPAVLGWQRRLDPLWTRIAGGCHLDRRIDHLIRDAGFQIVDLEQEYAKGPRPFAYVYRGCARPA